ncbi:MAG: pilin [Candidatus Jorgensenbacteria bacterium]|nr:pilin [Candidatus Jorgensenbacteria bacterium]
MLKGIKNSITFLALSAPTFALAQVSHAVDTPQGVVNLIVSITNWAYYLLLILAVLFIVYAAYMFLFSQGDTEKLEKAKKQIVYAVIAVAIAILAKGIIAFTQNILGAGTADTSQPSINNFGSPILGQPGNFNATPPDQRGVPGGPSF